MKKKWTFADILVFWFCISIVLGMLVGALRMSGVLEHDPRLYILAQLGCGLTLLVNPVSPVRLEVSWGAVKSHRLIRVLAAAGLLLSAAAWI